VEYLLESALLFVCQIEARSVEHMRNVAKGLENKIIELQQNLDEKVSNVVVLYQYINPYHWFYVRLFVVLFGESICRQECCCSSSKY